ncbi:MAG: SAM-dependent chlorinase/fluorinase [Bacteroidota bacterium]|nr:SAM-dependent chlorinase/fluorinase [Bacteroidota bacterium]
MRTQSLISLLTDFGSMDGYVASMKGVIISRVPNCKIIDISHAVEPQNIDQAAYLLWSSFRYFPKNTIFVCVVDPGVGTSRKIICAEADGYKFLAPDNGLLKFVFGTLKKMKIVSVQNRKYFLPKISNTFNGRDIFAPVAVHLAKGLPIKNLGPTTTPLFHAERFVEILPIAHEQYEGKIIHIDRFGNIVTNYFFSNHPKDRMQLVVGRETINDFSDTYTGKTGRKPFMIRGSSELLEVSVRNGNASKLLNVKLNQKIRLRIE